MGRNRFASTLGCLFGFCALACLWQPSVWASCGDWLHRSGWEMDRLARLVGERQPGDGEVVRPFGWRVGRPGVPLGSRPCSGPQCRQAPTAPLPAVPVAVVQHWDHFCWFQTADATDGSGSSASLIDNRESLYVAVHHEPPDPPPRVASLSSSR